MISIAHKAVIRILPALAFLLTSLTLAVAAENAAERYHSAYARAGFLLRASGVCPKNLANAKALIDAAFSPLGTSELRAISSGYPKTIEGWMHEGADTFNGLVMKEGVGPACAASVAQSKAADYISSSNLAESSKPEPEQSQDPVQKVTLTGTCKAKFLNRESFLDCDPDVTFVNLQTHRSEYTFTAQGETIFIFTGGKDRQPNLENYYLSIDTVKFGNLKGQNIEGAQGKVEGECHMRMSADGDSFYEVKCDAYDRNSGLGFNFHLTDITKVQK